MRNAEISAELDIIEVKPGHKFSVAMLKRTVPNTETALFFGKLYELNAQQLSNLLRVLFNNDSVIEALTGECHVHSRDLQDYVVEIGYEQYIYDGEIDFITEAPPATVLPQLWESAELEVAQSIKDVATKLGDVVGHMPGKEGSMIFKSMMMLNAKRPILGDFKARIQHKRISKNLVILDVSGSMSETTIKTIVDDVVALSWKAEACLAIVSNTTTFWNPGEFSSKSVLDAAEFSGTHYETLADVLNADWGVVVTIADYDSSYGAQEAIAKCTGSIELLLDISLVDSPTFLAQCVGQKAKEIRPLLVAASNTTLTR